MSGSSRSHPLPGGPRRRRVARLVVRLAPALERARERLALLVPQVAPLTRRLAGLLPPFTRLLGKYPPRLLAAGRRHEQRHRRARDRAEDECYDDGAGSAVISRHASLLKR